jgi:hypothetical protein
MHLIAQQLRMFMLDCAVDNIIAQSINIPAFPSHAEASVERSPRYVNGTPVMQVNESPALS